jgi:hypothetical protein
MLAAVAERAGWPRWRTVMIRKVERRGETRLVVDITWKKKDGTQGRYRRDAEVQTMAAARAEERRILANIAQYGDAYEPKPEAPKDESKPAPSTSIRFTEAVDSFRKGKAITNLKPSTRKGHEEILETRLLPRFGKRPISSIGFEDASALDAEMVKEGLSVSRRRNVLIVLRSILGAACDAGKLPELPKLPRLPRSGVRSSGRSPGSRSRRPSPSRRGRGGWRSHSQHTPVFAPARSALSAGRTSIWSRRSSW